MAWALATEDAASQASAPCPCASQIFLYNAKLKRLNKKKRIQKILIQKIKIIFHFLNFSILNMYVRM
jgi:hypothetical protein